MLHRLFSFLIAICTLFLLLQSPASALTPAPKLDARQAYFVNLETGRILFAENESEQTATGGFSKIMTILLALEEAEDLDTMLTVSDSALSGISNATTVKLQVGEQMGLRNLLYCISMRSAADACNVVAEYIGGTIDKFIEKMNTRAAEIGCKDTHFVNAHGLDGEGGYTTAEDLYLLTREAVANPLFMDFVNLQYKNIPATNLYSERRFPSNNSIILSSPDYMNSNYYYKYARGIMSSYTNNSGYSLITLIRKDGANYISIVLNATKDKETKLGHHYLDTKALGGWVLENYTAVQMLKEKEPVTQVPIALSSSTDSIVLVAKKDFSTILPTGVKPESIEKKIELKQKKLKAPVKENEELGSISFYVNGEKYGEAPLLAQNDVEANSILYVIDKISSFFSTIYFKIAFVLLLIGGGGYIYLSLKMNKKRRNSSSSYRRRRY